MIMINCLWLVHHSSNEQEWQLTIFYHAPLHRRPIIYWNLVWYFSRLHLPTYLPLFTLWAFTHGNRELQRQCVQLKLKLLWDSGQVSGVQDPLYLVWLGKGAETRREGGGKGGEEVCV